MSFKDDSIKSNNYINSIEGKRKFIHDELIKEGISPNFKHVSLYIAQRCFEMIDQYFYGGWIHETIEQKGHSLVIDVIDKNDAGTCMMKGDVHTLSISKKVFDSVFKNENEVYKANGLECKDKIECLQLVIEHESLHMCLHLYYPLGSSNQRYAKTHNLKYISPHGKQFKCMSETLFGHKTIYHNIVSGEKCYSICDEVWFRERGVKKIGIVRYIKNDERTIGGFVEVEEVNTRKLLKKQLKDVHLVGDIDEEELPIVYLDKSFRNVRMRLIPYTTKTDVLFFEKNDRIASDLNNYEKYISKDVPYEVNKKLKLFPYKGFVINKEYRNKLLN